MKSLFGIAFTALLLFITACAVETEEETAPADVDSFEAGDSFES